MRGAVPGGETSSCKSFEMGESTRTSTRELREVFLWLEKRVFHPTLDWEVGRGRGNWASRLILFLGIRAMGRHEGFQAVG